MPEGAWRGSAQRLDPAERWMADGLRISDSPGLLVRQEVDMSCASQAIRQLRDEGIKATYTHVFVYSAARALAHHPDLHRLVIGDRQFLPDNVAIGLSVAGSSVVAPVLVIAQAQRKSLREIASEILAKSPSVRDDNARMLADLRRRGALVPFGWLRRWILRIMMRNIKFRCNGVGTFQISCLKDVDQFTPLLLATGALMSTGRVCDRVIVVDGAPQVRPTAIICCGADHKVWDGSRAARFINEVKRVLEAGPWI